MSALTSTAAGPLAVRPIADGDRMWVHDVVCDSWGADVVVSRGRVHHVLDLPGFVALSNSHHAGVVTYSIDDERLECEVVTLDAVERERGVGKVLLQAVAEVARQRNCWRLWLVTTNDNLHALRFYQRLGWDLVALHRGAVTDARAIKPQIPLLGDDDIEIRHELELELRID